MKANYLINHSTVQNNSNGAEINTPVIMNFKLTNLCTDVNLDVLIRTVSIGTNSTIIQFQVDSIHVYKRAESTARWPIRQIIIHAPSTCFDLYKVIIREVYKKAYK